ncbi:uncharacterized protein BX663DRAFT_18933 [Cokeromyces recurvatus]|uniref:uncharacterized protein n=1 Tax=Cokeromyces recurvatus TaxID=90255 RepID=UPI00221E5EF7|nr:uncharacterized protein BX663DRAFT_18933 [Cokeromyces recurvatus]KAI7908058.1 hypothetical protein BX663DRAFT_18933 [Cokeromyces recurvatus]
MNLSDQQKDLILVSPSTSSIITVQDGELTAIASSEMTKSPYSLLQEHATQILDRLRGSDIRALNRKLKRAFDITELSSMSNSIIDNILMDVDTLESRFLWMNDKRQLFSRDDKVAFFPLLELLKSMLKELGMLKTTMNDFQVEYVKKVEENKMRVEKEIMKGNQQELSIHDDAISSNHHQQQQSSSLSLKRRSSNRPLSWFSSIFSVASNQKSDQIIHHDKQEESTMTDTLLLPNNKQQRHSSLSHHHYSPENQITNTRINRDYYYKSTHSPSNTSHLISTTTTSWLGGK